VLLSDSRFTEQIKRECSQVKAIIREKSMAEELGAAFKKLKCKTLALPGESITLAQRKRIAEHIKPRHLVKLDDGLLIQRAVKSDDEIKLITQAARIQQKAYAELLKFMKPGKKETEAAAFLEYRMRAHGADGTSFPSIIAADANAALPHYRPGDAKLKKGGVVLIDWGARYKGYCSDMTRVIAFGSMKKQLSEVYQIVLDAQLLAIDAIAPGKKLREIDDVARKHIKKHGYGKQFGHGLGHGIGLDIHEQPVLSYRAPEDGILEPGHVVTVEPGIYLPGVGGVRIEDDVLVTAKGRRVLTDLPKSLDSAII
jgi:Xaa-Pro aminopeptidase